MAQRTDFSCMAAWQVFDNRNIGYLSAEEFVGFLCSYIGSAFCNSHSAISLYTRHDCDMDGKINYVEFCRMLVPKIDRQSQTKLLDRSSPVADRLSYETHDLIRRVFLAHLRLESVTDILREKLAEKLKRECMSLQDLFSVCDDNNIGVLTDCNIECMLIDYRKSGSRTLI